MCTEILASLSLADTIRINKNRRTHPEQAQGCDPICLRQLDVKKCPAFYSVDATHDYSILFHELIHNTGHESRLITAQNSSKRTD